MQDGKGCGVMPSKSRNERNPVDEDLLPVPFARSYWVVPGLFLAGAYPGARDAGEAREKANHLLDAGIRRVINLMEPHEVDFWGSLISPYEEVLSEAAAKRGIHVEMERYPVVDMRIPEPERMRSILDSIDAAMETRVPVYAHCLGGIGRTGTVVGCFLIRHGLARAESVLEQIARLRRQDPAAHRPAPEAPVQREFLRRWADREGRQPGRLGRFVGCLLGTAAGDALGVPVGFMSAAEIRANYGDWGIAGFDRAFGRYGAITDDTQMSLFTAEGLLRAWTRGSLRGVCDIASVVYNAYLRWLQTQEEDFEAVSQRSFLTSDKRLFSSRAPGNSCLSALHSRDMGTLQKPVNNSKGCGAVMRMAPAGLIQEDPEEAFQTGCELGAITHGHPTGYLGAGTLAALICRIKNGESLGDAVLAACRTLKAWPDHGECLAAVEGAIDLAGRSEATTEAVESLGAGWVAEEALSIAVFCALAAKGDFSAGVRAAVNHGGDSDSAGAICGSILGCRLGGAAIPAGWADSVELADLIKQVAMDLFIRFRDDRAWWNRYPGY